MSIWLLGNLAHSGIVTSQSYVEIMAELLEISESTLFSMLSALERSEAQRAPQPLSLGLSQLLFQGHVRGKKKKKNLIKMGRSV